LVIAGVGCLFTALVTLVQPFYTVNLWVSDQLFTAESPSPNIVVIGIDDASLQTYGRWSDWPRRLHAQAVKNLSQAGAKVIGFDVIFASSSSDDESLAEAMKEGNNVVLASAGIERIPTTESAIAFDSFLVPSDSLKEAYVNSGHVNVVPDRDGKVRRLPIIAKDAAGQTYPAFSVAVLHTLFSIPLPEQYVLRGNTLDLAGRNIPVDNSFFLRINYSAEIETFDYISYGDVISGNFDPSVVRNKIVLIGMTATAETDTWSIPTHAGKVPGVFIHAVTIDTILRQRFLSDANRGVTALLMLLLVGIAAYALPRFGTWYWTDLAKGAGLMGGLFVVYLVASFFTFDAGHILNILYPLLQIALIYVGSILCILVIEQSDKRFVKDLFGRHVSPQVARELVKLADTGGIDLGGEEREVTVFFADMRNFTQLSEHLTPGAVVQMLNKYFSVIVDSVVRNGGIVNKFGGDNVMAIWNAPQLQSEHALLAVKSAWEAQQRIAGLQGGEPSAPRVQFGIGINTGKALAGNIGSVGRVEYTVIGDAVNLASRICGVTPGGEVWLGPETYHQVADHLEVEALEPQKFKGKAELIAVYRVTGWRQP